MNLGATYILPKPNVSIWYTMKDGTTQLKNAAPFSITKTNLQINSVSNRWWEAGFASLGAGFQNSLYDPVYYIAADYYKADGAVATCGKLTAMHFRTNATSKILSAYGTKVQIDDTIAGKYFLALMVDIPCTAPGSAGTNWVYYIEGSAIIPAETYQLYKFERKDVFPQSRGTRSAKGTTGGSSESRGPFIERRESSPAPAKEQEPQVSKRLFARADSNAGCRNGMCQYTAAQVNKVVADTDWIELDSTSVGPIFPSNPPSDWIAGKGFQSICSMTFKGSAIALAASVTGPLNWLAQVAGVADWFEIFASLPVNPDDYYVLGLYGAGEIQIATAINVCQGEFLFAAKGLEVKIPIEFAEIVVSLDAMGFSIPGQIKASALGVVTEFWSPAGSVTIDISGNIYAQGSVTLEIGDSAADTVTFEVAAKGTVLAALDPKGDGAFKGGDSALALQVAVSPTIVLLKGKLKLDMAAVASANAAIVYEYLNSSYYQLVVQATFSTNLAGLLTSVIPAVGPTIGPPLNLIYGGYQIQGSFDVYVGKTPDVTGWGARMCELIAWRFRFFFAFSRPLSLQA